MEKALAFVGLFGDIKPKIQNIVRPSQAAAIFAEISSSADGRTMQQYPLEVSVTQMDGGTVRVTFGYVGKPALASIRIGPRGGVS